MPYCSYKLFECENSVKYWVRREGGSFWFALCDKHFKKIVKKGGWNLTELMKETQRMRRFKKRKSVNWKMFLDWEELEYHPRIKIYDKSFGDIKITMALKEFRKAQLEKCLKKIVANT